MRKQNEDISKSKGIKMRRETESKESELLLFTEVKERK